MGADTDPSLEASYEGMIDRIIPLNWDQTPEDVGQLVVFYATNRNVTGQIRAVDDEDVSKHIFLSRSPDFDSSICFEGGFIPMRVY